MTDRQNQLDQALGYMVGRAAMTEFFLHQAIRRLVGGQYAGFVTASLSASAALDVIQRIVAAGEFSDEASREMKEFADASRAAFTERNRYVHGLRVIGEGEDLILISNRRKGSIDQFRAEVQELRQLGEGFSRLAGKILSWINYYIEGKPRRSDPPRPSA